MRDHGNALVKATIAWLAEDEGLAGMLGQPARIWAQPPQNPAYPHLLIGRSEGRDVPADGCGVEHLMTLTCVSTVAGAEEARAIVAAVRARLGDAVLAADGVRTVSVRMTFAEVFRTADFRRTCAVMRVRAVTEEAEIG